MNIAGQFASLSYAQRLKVGCIIVKDGRIISFGYNGMPSGWENKCEYSDGESLVTRQEVLHAETNAISKLARSTESGEGATMFVTHSPCIHCAKIIYQSGIKALFYGEDYRDSSGVDFLKQSEIKVTKI